MADKIRLAAIVRKDDGFLALEDLGVCERGMGGRFGCVTPNNTLAIVEKASAEYLMAELKRWLKVKGKGGD